MISDQFNIPSGPVLGSTSAHLLLLAESGRASRHRYLGHPAAGTGRPRLRSQATIADFASGLRAGHQEALPEVPCRGDVFHALYNVGPLVRYLENRAYEAIDARAKLERKQATAERRHGRKDQSLAKKLSYARPAEAKAIALADEVALLARWLRDDILSVAGPEYAIRRDLLDFVVAELRPRVGLSASDQAGKDLAGETAGQSFGLRCGTGP